MSHILFAGESYRCSSQSNSRGCNYAVVYERRGDLTWSLRRLDTLSWKTVTLRLTALTRLLQSTNLPCSVVVATCQHSPKAAAVVFSPFVASVGFQGFQPDRDS